MGRDARDEYDERPRASRYDGDQGDGRTLGPRRGTSRPDGPPRPTMNPNARSSGQRSDSDPSQERRSSGRAGLPRSGSPHDDGASSGRRPGAGRDSYERRTRGPEDREDFSGPSRAAGSDRDGPPRNGRRRMADMARDLSRSMSRQLSSVMERTGRALRNGNDGTGSSLRMPRPAPHRTPLPAELAAQVESLPYRRSRARMLARKWRLSRKQANPIVVALVIMVCAVAGLAVTFGGAFGGVYAYNYYSSHRAQIQAIAAEKNHASSQILDRNGTVLATIKDDNGFKIYLSIDQISPKLQWATIDTEDRTFYSNVGIDFVGTLRSAFTDLAHGGAAVQGGSTITQQLVKLIVAKDSTKTYVRKLNEAILAYGVTQEYNKAQILEMYLNTIPYGDSNTGIEAAARNYFRILPKPDGTTANMQLSWAQSAMLAGVPNAPTVYQPNVYSCKKTPCTMAQWDDPYIPGQECGTLIPSFYDYGNEWYLTHGHEWLVYCRALKVLDNMHRYGVGDGSATFTNADYTQAKAEVQKILENQLVYSWQDASTSGSPDTAVTTKLAPNFVDYVEGILNDWGYTDLGNAGIRVYTTLDYNLQKYAETDLDYYINKPHANPWYCPGCGNNEPPISQASNGNDGALIAIDQHTGDIMAMVGSVNYNNKDPLVAGQVNITVAPRSMGSATKPLVYATDLQMGWTPGTMLQDVPICFPDPNVDPTDQKPVQDQVAQACKGWYVPHNYDALNYSGRFPLRYMWGNSLNIAATEGLAFAGWNPAHSQNFISMAERLGVTSLKANAMGPTTALGTQDIPMIQLASAYGTFGNQGKRVPPRAILRIEDNTGNQIYPVPPGPSIAPPVAGQQVVSPETAYMVTSVLTDNLARAQDFGYAKNPLHFSPPTVDGTNYPDFEFAAKTGTSSGPTGPRDIVTFGYSNYLTLGVWMGNANSVDMAGDIIGIAGAGYVFHDVMLYGIQHLGWNTNSHFPIPSDLGRTYFNCTTGLAPYKGTKVGDMSDPSFACPFAPWDPKYNRNLYNHDTGNITAQPDADWYIKNQPWLQS